ncbi:CPBP family intramembrane glutamic endopeptidase [Bacillus litorisediminis]|uniref:CPBP family intramembrane glutamic endopeptidase n=1 Tax=Bacillus litorisediminis TaxID=2922713 RepID=UPI001FACD201|nr:type II CAAX endopeptidase family protein [Bacillus litorisediminis]
MKKEYWLIIITFIAMQLSGLVGVPIVSTFLTASGQDPITAQQDAAAYWTLLSFIIGLLIVLWLLRKEMQPVRTGTKLTTGEAVTWGFIGFFLALLAQFIGIQIENLLGIEAGSENTEFIIRFIEAYPFIIIASSIAGPILEEIVFRKVIFGNLYQRTNFWIAGIASSLIFALFHFDFQHIILYTFSGLAFAYLYVKTERIWVPIMAHVLFNTFVVVIQFMARDQMAATGLIFGG